MSFKIGSKFKIRNLKFTCLLKNKRGAIAFVTVLLVAAILFEIALVGLVLSFLSGAQGFDLHAAHVARYAARSGINDVLLRITRDKTFVPSTNPYTLSVEGGSASVLVTRTLPAANYVQYVIVSTGTSGSKKIRYTSTFVISDLDGSVSGAGMAESGI
jgi:hypothetical protein